MQVDYKELEKTLAQHRVYDAWQYVKSHRETLAYMSMSYEMLVKVYAQRASVIENIKYEKIDKVLMEEIFAQSKSTSKKK